MLSYSNFVSNIIGIIQMLNIAHTSNPLLYFHVRHTHFKLIKVHLSMFTEGLGF